MATAMRVLVVDDMEEIRTIVGLALGFLGHIAELVDTAEKALKAFDADRFDVLITDLCLPGMNGDQLARRVKREDAGCLIILLTGYPPQRTPEGVDVVLPKPF